MPAKCERVWTSSRKTFSKHITEADSVESFDRLIANASNWSKSTKLCIDCFIHPVLILIMMLWNALPDNVRSVLTLSAFKKQLKTTFFKDIYG